LCGTEAAKSSESEKITEDIGKINLSIIESVPYAADAGFPISIVCSSFIRVGKDLISFVDLFECFLRPGVFVNVRMIFSCEVSESCF